MLEPNRRTLLLDCLQPPEGFALDEAIGTTYSLDLYALLSVPVTFVFRDAMSEDGQANPLATLEGLRRYAAHVHLFCQAGEIHVPRGQQRLFAYLEDSVIPVSPADDAGVFHPKCWLLRFTGADEAVRYRFVCLSRNLTFDRSWDSVLVLDGAFEGERVTAPDARPIAEFVNALPGLARVDLSAGTRAAVARMAEELPRVRFQYPGAVESMRFWPMGVGVGAAPDFEPAKQPLLVASPFLSEGWLRRTMQERNGAWLVSRDDQLQGLAAETRTLFDEHFNWRPDATPETDVEARAEDENLLDGLHAKLFVMDDGRWARVWTGSANATHAAFHHNVELLVEMVGRKKYLGIGGLLNEDGERGFRDLLEPWRSPTGEVEAPDTVAERLEARLREARRAFAGADLTAAVSASDTEGQYSLTIDGDWPALPVGVTGTLRPIGLEPEQARELGAGPVAFAAITLEALSAFVAVELSAAEEGRTQRSRFVLRVPLDGVPDDRGSRLLRSMLSDRGAFMRLLMILLADNGVEAIMNAGLGESTSKGGDWFSGGSEAPLLESLLKTLDRSPERLDQIQRLMDDVAESGDLDDMLPEGFSEVWAAVWANRASAGTASGE